MSDINDKERGTIGTSTQKNIGIFDSLTNPLLTSVGPNERKTGLEVADGTEVFADHLVQYLKKVKKDNLKISLLKCLASEVGQKVFNQNTEKQNEKGTGPKTKSTSTVDRNLSSSEGTEQKIVSEEEESFLVREYAKKFENDSKRIPEGIEMWNYILSKFGQKNKKKFNPCYNFPFEIYKTFKYNLLKSKETKQDLQDYLISFIHYCSAWVEPNGFKEMPVVYPCHVRKPEMQLNKSEGSKKKVKSNKIDMRGFKIASNPIHEIKSYIVEVESEGASKKAEKSPIKDIEKGQYKGKSVDSGFEACHIWYDTTRAPPMFTFIPNIVWLPTMLSKLSDKEIKKKLVGTSENFFARTLREYSRYNYGEIYKNSKSSMSKIIKGIWLGLGEQDIVEDWRDITKKTYKHISNANCNFMGYSGSPNNLDKCKDLSEKIETYICECQSGKEETEKEKGDIKERNWDEPLIKDWYKEYNEKYLKPGESPIQSKDQETKKFLDILEFIHNTTPGSKPKDFKKWLAELRVPRKKNINVKHKDALRDLVFLSEDDCFADVYDIKIWLKKYHEAVVKEKKKALVKQIKNLKPNTPPDKLKQVVGIDPSGDVNKKISEMNLKTKEKELTNIDDINTLDEKKLNEVIENIDQEEEEKVPCEDKGIEEPKGECSPGKIPFDLKDFARELCNNRGDFTPYAPEKKKKKGSHRTR